MKGQRESLHEELSLSFVETSRCIASKCNNFILLSKNLSTKPPAIFCCVTQCRTFAHTTNKLDIRVMSPMRQARRKATNTGRAN